MQCHLFREFIQFSTSDVNFNLSLSWCWGLHIFPTCFRAEGTFEMQNGVILLIYSSVFQGFINLYKSDWENCMSYETVLISLDSIAAKTKLSSKLFNGSNNVLLHFPFSLVVVVIPSFADFCLILYKESIGMSNNSTFSTFLGEFRFQ